MTAGPRVDGDALRHFGVYPALVTDIVDADRLGRVKVSFPWLGSADATGWATIVSPYADDDQGFQFIPSEGTQVLVAFEAGDLRRPYVLGASWNGSEALPEPPEAANDRRRIRTRSGHDLLFDDAEGAAKVTLTTGGGHVLELDDVGSVTLSHSNGSLIEIDTAGEISITANATIEMTASALNVHAPMATFDGVVNCQTLIASTGVVSPSYTPGAGNIW